MAQQTFAERIKEPFLIRREQWPRALAVEAHDADLAALGRQRQEEAPRTG